MLLRVLEVIQVSVTDGLANWNLLIAQSLHSELSGWEERILFVCLFYLLHGDVSIGVSYAVSYAILGFRLSVMRYGMKKTEIREMK